MRFPPPDRKPAVRSLRALRAERFARVAARNGPAIGRKKFTPSPRPRRIFPGMKPTRAHRSAAHAASRASIVAMAA
jgi:hypothetical protein